MNEDATAEPDLVSVSVRIPRDTYDQLRDIAYREYRPVAAEVRRLIQEHVDSHESREAA